MPKGQTGSCAFCSLPADVRDRAIVAWRTGKSYQTLRQLLAAEGHSLSIAQLQYCPCRSGHHDRGDLAEVAHRAADRLGKIADLLERSGINPEDIGKIQSVRLSEWEGLTKDEDNNAVVTPLTGSSIVLTPTWDTGPAWPVVDRVARLPVKIPGPTRRKKTELRRAVILPDVQIGYRRDIDSGDLDPFHDERAIAAALRVVQKVEPDIVVHLGDMLDFASFGVYEQEASFSLTVQPALDRAHRFLAEVATAAPGARQLLLEGNHDRRLQRSIVRNALAAFGIRKANAPESWPVLSVPYLLRLDELGVEYVGGYPAGIVWINDRLACIHGSKVRSSGSTAAAVVASDTHSIVFGHVHRIEMTYRTRLARNGSHTSVAASPGCLCRVDGSVPSVKGSTDPLGRPIPTVENWQQGLCVVSYEEGDGPFTLEIVPIEDGRVVFRGEVL